MGFLTALALRAGLSENAAPIVARLIKYFLIGCALYLAYLLLANHHYNRGVTDCETKQVKADAEVVQVIPEVIEEVATVEAEKQTERVEVHKTYNTGLTASDLKFARLEGEAEGQKAGRREVYEEIRANGGCLNQPYSDGDRLHIKARAQQQRFIETGIGSHKRKRADEELSGRPSQVNTFSDGPPVNYPQPD